MPVTVVTFGDLGWFLPSASHVGNPTKYTDAVFIEVPLQLVKKQSFCNSRVLAKCKPSRWSSCDDAITAPTHWSVHFEIANPGFEVAWGLGEAQLQWLGLTFFKGLGLCQGDAAENSYSQRLVQVGLCCRRRGDPLRVSVFVWIFFTNPMWKMRCNELKKVHLVLMVSQKDVGQRLHSFQIHSIAILKLGKSFSAVSSLRWSPPSILSKFERFLLKLT